ncbi:hypothetical protein FCJ61_11045 [Burkholderia metallica]|nr:hypothetical protein [Burkholderia metallica]NTZ83522.1 hypothetical protein [Burkholderia metallica]
MAGIVLVGTRIVGAAPISGNAPALNGARSCKATSSNGEQYSARAVVHRITSYFPIASDCITFAECKQAEAGKFNRLSVSPARRASPRFRMLHSGNSIPFISRCEINRGVIANITHSDLAIISRQVI